MGCRGVHFALTEEEAVHLRSLPSDLSRLTHVMEVIEEHYFAKERNFLAESDKSWDAIGRALTSTPFRPDRGEPPLCHVIHGGESLYSGNDYIMSLKTPEQVDEIAAALSSIAEDDFRAGYQAMSAESYGYPKSDDDFDYTWAWFQHVRELYLRASAASRYVLFTVDL